MLLSRATNLGNSTNAITNNTINFTVISDILSNNN